MRKDRLEGRKDTEPDFHRLEHDPESDLLLLTVIGVVQEASEVRREELR